MSITVDANIIMAALVKAGVVRSIVTSHPKAWVMPVMCRNEVWRHRDRWNRNRLDDGRLAGILHDLLECVEIVSAASYACKIEEAATLVRDQDDAEVLALAMARENIGLWTFNVKDYAPAAATGKVRLLTTRDVAAIYPANI